METKTIADYTLKWKVEPKIYENYRKNIFPTDPHSNVNYGFSIYLKEEFEKMMRVSSRKSESGGKEFRVA